MASTPIRHGLFGLATVSLVACGQATAPNTAAPSTTDRTVTLPTGDHVTLSAQGAVHFTPGPGRAHIRHVTVRTGGQTFVVPHDALKQLASHTVKPSAFRVTAQPGDNGDDDGSGGSGDDDGDGDGNFPNGPFDPPAGVPAVDLTVSVIGLDGKPGEALFTILDRQNSADADPVGFFSITGTETVRIQKGQFSLYEFSNDPLFLGAPQLDLDHDNSITFDSRRAKPIQVTVPGLALTVSQIDVAVWDLTNNNMVTSGNEGDGDVFATAQVGPDLPADEFRSWVATGGTPIGEPPLEPEAGEVPGFADTYAFAHAERGHVVTGWIATVPASQLATIDVVGAGESAFFISDISALPADARPDAAAFSLPAGFSADFGVGVHHTQHVFGQDVVWDQGASVIATGDIPFASVLYDAIRTYVPGHHYREAFNRAPYGPALTPSANAAPATRQGDALTFLVSGFADRSLPSYHEEGDETGTTTLSQNGTLIATSPPFAFPEVLTATGAPSDATYRLATTYDRGLNLDGTVLFDLSTHATADWTFRSQHTGGLQVLPLPTLRFVPELGANANAPGSVLVLPAVVERPAGAGTPRITSVSVDVSFDDGATWSSVPGALLGDRFVGLVLGQPATGFASLRGHVTDVDGRDSHVEIIRAYRLGN